MSCLDENQLIELIEGLLEAQQTAEVERHLAACSSCREALSALVAAGLVDPPSDKPATTSSSSEDDDDDDDGDSIDAVDAFAPGVEVDGLVVLRRLGGGGMGEVLLARDERLGRNLALKVIRPSLLGSREAHERFLREARATARCVHPNIVTLHTVGEHRGQPYLALEYVDGQTLEQLLATRQPAIDEALFIGRGLAEALAEAHRHGVLHRDLKPANVIIGQGGRPRVLDFGLAKAVADQRLSSEDDAEVGGATKDAGTPLYMAPEQWRGEPATEASDVWALGVILYRLLSGVHPLKEDATAASSIERLRETVIGPDAILSVGSVAPQLFAPAAAFVDRCLSKKAERRPSARAAAAELAELTTTLARRRRRRRLRIAGLAALALLALVAVVVAGLLAGKERESARQRAEALRQRHEALRQQARTHVEAAELARLQNRPLLARAHLRRALEIEDSLVVRARLQQLAEQPLRWRASFGSMIYAIEPIARRRMIAVAARDGTIRLVDATTSMVRGVLRGHRDQVISLAASADGRLLASGSWDGAVWLWRLDVAPPAGRCLGRHAGIVRALALSSNNNTLISAGDGQLRRWPLADHQGQHGDQPAKPSRLAHDGSEVRFIALDSRGGLLLASGASLLSASKQAIDQPGAGTATIAALASSASGRHVALARGDGAVELWDGRDLVRRRSWRASVGSLTAVAVDDSGTVATASIEPAGGKLQRAPQIRLWSAKGQLLGEVGGHQTTVSDLAFESARLFSADHRGELRCWRKDRIARGRFPSAGHQAGVLGAGFSPDGKLIASGSADRTVRVWRAATGAAEAVLRGHEAAVSRALFGPKGQWLVSTSYDATVRLWRRDALGSWRAAHLLQGHQGRVRGAVFASERQLITFGDDRTIRVWGQKSPAASWSELQRHTQPAAVLDVAVSPGGRLLAAAGADGVVRVLRHGWRGPAQLLRGHRQSVWGVAFASDARLVSGAADGTVRSWKIGRSSSEGSARVLLRLSGSRVYWLAVDQASGVVGVPASDSTAYLLPLDNPPAEPMRLFGHRAEVDYVRFDPKSNRALTTSDDGTLRLWQLAPSRAPSAAWRTIALSAGALVTHRGWQPLGGAEKPSPAQRRWKQAALAAQSAAASGGTLCLRRADGSLQRWSLLDDRVEATVKNVADARSRLAAVGGGCVVCGAGGAVLFNGAGRQQLASQCTALAPATEQIIIGSGAVVRSFDRSGRPIGQRGISKEEAAEATITALSADGALVGLSGGGIVRRALKLTKGPPAPVVSIVEGRGGMIAVGFANGRVIIWSADGEQRVREGRLHGAASHLDWSGGERLVAASDLGDYLIWDTRWLLAPWCEALRWTWAEVAVSAGESDLQPAEPPRSHSCLRKK